MTFDEAMEPLFRYVDGLADEQRDRIVTAQEWKRGNWGEAWDSAAATSGEADRCKKAKANDTVEEEGGDDMFTRAGVAAE